MAFFIQTMMHIHTKRRHYWMYSHIKSEFKKLEHLVFLMKYQENTAACLTRTF